MELPKYIHELIIHVWELENIIISVIIMLQNGGVQFTGLVLKDS